MSMDVTGSQVHIFTCTLRTSCVDIKLHLLHTLTSCCPGTWSWSILSVWSSTNEMLSHCGCVESVTVVTVWWEHDRDVNGTSKNFIMLGAVYLQMGEGPSRGFLRVLENSQNSVDNSVLTWPHCLHTKWIPHSGQVGGCWWRGQIRSLVTLTAGDGWRHHFNTPCHVSPGTKWWSGVCAFTKSGNILNAESWPKICKTGQIMGPGKKI